MVSMEATVAGIKGTASCLALGIAIATIRSRQLKPPSELFSALAACCGLFRTLEPTSKRTAACLSSIALFRLLNDKHKHIVLSYALVELALQVYERCPQSKVLEHATSIAIASRFIYAYLLRWEWVLPSQLKIVDKQACLSPEILAAARAELRYGNGSRCHAFHPNKSCAKFLRDECFNHVQSGAKIFLPIHAIAAFFAWKNQRLDMSKQVVDYVKSIFCLLGSFVFPLVGSCMIPLQNHEQAIFLASLTPNIAQLIEPPKRRLTIRKAIASYSLITVFYQLKEYKCFSTITRHQVITLATIIYATCMVYLLEHPERQNRWLMYALYGHDIRQAKNKKISNQEYIVGNKEIIPSQSN
ncbi:hypothetical protein THRCLA_02831 [Thraustotheca clavata]|uniref:Uncharacterized protein n=1 Tax=Thraustotheca clavata TaxID=74557 RepID=A0A1W0A3X6_9STRA|nr:hypothetical protein THRCLA_02831 [Thraustotheca clavata]